MKRLSVLLIIAILLCACTGSSPSSASVRVTALPQSQAQPEQGLIKTEDKLIATNNAGITQLFLQEEISEACYLYLLDFVSGTNMYSGISVSDYTITINKEKANTNGQFDFEYTVTKSDLAKIPTGTHTDKILDGAFVIVAEDKEWSIPKEIANETAVKMVKSWLGTYTIEPVLFGKGYDYGEVVNYLTAYYGNGTLELAKFQQLAKDKFGIEPHEPYLKEIVVTDGIVSKGDMGGSMAYDFISCEKAADTGDSLVRVQFYADAARRVPAKLMEYRISSDERFLDTKVIEQQKYYTPYGALEVMRGFNVPFTDVDEYIKYAKGQNESNTLGEFVKAFLTNDAAKMQQMMMNTGDEEITEQLSNVKVKPNSYIIYASPESSEGVMVNVELESDAGYGFNAGFHSYNIYNGMMNFCIAPASRVEDSVTFASRWISHYLDPIYQNTLLEMPTNDTTSLEEFIMFRLMVKNPNETSFTFEQLAEYAKKYLGIDNLNPDSYKQSEVTVRDENGMYFIPARGGNATMYRIIEDNYSREYPELTVQFYADVSKMIKSHVVKYKLHMLDGEYALQEVEVIEKSNLEPLRWSV